MLVGGMTRVEIGSALLSDGATTAEVSAAYVEHLLAPWLRPGQIVILNNLSAQTNVRRRRLVEAARYQIRFLLAYSPDFSPIELAFSRLKTHGLYAQRHAPAATWSARLPPDSIGSIQ